MPSTDNSTIYLTNVFFFFFLAPWTGTWIAVFMNNMNDVLLMGAWAAFIFPLSDSLLTRPFLFCNSQPSRWSPAGLPHYNTGAHFLLSKTSSSGRLLPHPAGVGAFPQKEEVELSLLGLRSKHAHSLGGDARPTQRRCPWGFSAA